MENAASYFSAFDALKREHLLPCTNLFLNSKELENIFRQNQCFFHRAAASIFLIIPFHPGICKFYYSSKSARHLLEDLPPFLKDYSLGASLAASVIGKGQEQQAQTDALTANGFSPVKKLLRMRLEAPPPRVLAAMRSLAAEYLDSVSFASLDDAEEIHSILVREFDLVGDNVPTLQELEENIRHKNVSVVKMNGIIAAVHYFSFGAGVKHGYFDVTLEQFRKKSGLLFALNIFEDKYFQARQMKIRRSYGWRQAGDKRLLKNSALINSSPDGVVIDNLIYRP